MLPESPDLPERGGACRNRRTTAGLEPVEPVEGLPDVPDEPDEDESESIRTRRTSWMLLSEDEPASDFWRRADSFVATGVAR